jgi:hypothetical protein
MTEYTLHFIVIEEEGCFIAQALEVDLNYQADSREDLCYEVQRGLAGRVMIAHEEGIEPFDVGPPPEEVRALALGGPFKVHFTVSGGVITFDDESTWRTVR